MGQRTGMCLLHQLTEHVDGGPICAHEEFIYPTACRLPKDYIAFHGARNEAFLRRFLTPQGCHGGADALPGADEAGVPHGQEDAPELWRQPDYLSSYWPRLRSDVNGWIDWSRWDAQELERFICAFDLPYGGARTRWRGRTVVLRDVYAQSTHGRFHPFQNGLVYRRARQWLHVAVTGGELLVCGAEDEGGNSLFDEIREGDRFDSLATDLEGSRRRMVKTQDGLRPQRDVLPTNARVRQKNGAETR
jgi:methionyl-tRNA formyltransferase